jgi:AmmeMemoRadiSam system protein A
MASESADTAMPPPTEHALVALARQAIVHYLRTGAYLDCSAELAAAWQRAAGAFVSLTQRGALRGCVGTCTPTQLHLGQEIIHNAVAAACADPRFAPVALDDLEEIDICVDVLTASEPVESDAQLDPKRYGVIVRAGTRGGVLLPDIPQVTTAEGQLAVARRKAGIRPDEAVEIYRFEVMRFH